MCMVVSEKALRTMCAHGTDNYYHFEKPGIWKPAHFGKLETRV